MCNQQVEQEAHLGANIKVVHSCTEASGITMLLVKAVCVVSFVIAIAEYITACKKKLPLKRHAASS